MSQPKPRIYKRLSLITLAVVNAFALLAMVPPQPVRAVGGDCSDVYTPLSSFVMTGVNNNKSFYIEAQNQTGVPWELLAAIHYRETNFSHNNPSNGQGIFQFLNGEGGPYPSGPVSDGEFVRQLAFMANRLQNDYVWRGSIPRERRKLVPNEQNEVIVKDMLFSYNGRSTAYANQGAQWGYNPSVQPYEGSPYVMNRFDCDRARMPMVTRDFGPIDGTDTRYGAFTLYARLRGESYWQSLWSPYAWAIDSFTFSGGDSTIGQGQTETLTLKARNTGKNPWYNHGDGPVRLATWGPPNRVSSIAHPSWMANIRPANLTESQVMPGDLGTFTFQVAANQAGKVVEELNLVVENYQWMRWPGFSPTIEFTGAYAWQIQDVIYERGTGLMDPGTSQLVTVKAKNTGSTTWNKFGGSPVRVGTWQPDRPSPLKHSGWMSAARAVDMNESTVAPGQVAGFQFYITTPKAGNFYERFNLVAEGQTWLNDAGLTLYVRGAEYAWQPVWTSISTGNINIPRNTDFTVTIRAKNTGDTTWRKTGFPVRLGTAAPLNRGSAFYTPGWMNAVRVTGLVEDAVAPGQEGTFTFTAHTPNSPGPWFERFSPVAEGLTWFTDNGYGIQINVQ
jgi:hypothetical protein